MVRTFLIVVVVSLAACRLAADNTAANETVAPTSRQQDGLQAYQANCAQCHEHGTNQAPVTGRSKDWADRSYLWEAVLFEHANKGYLAMPAKAGKPELEQYDVNVAAEYMMSITHPELLGD